jgi:Domain of unknown function (DUF3883)
MAKLEDCKHNSSAPIDVLKKLPVSQARTGRHRCTVCSYQRGFEDAQSGSPLLVETEDCQHRSIAPVYVLKNLSPSQAGAGRHKCATCAYKYGYEAGLKESTLLASLLSGKADILANPTKQSNLPKGKLEEAQPPNYSKSKKIASPTFKGNKVYDRAYREHKNAQLGKAGELLVIDYERNMLLFNGRKDLAKKIEHISEEEGDGAGYDIKSFNPDGSIKYIEVKTTRGSASTPFFITYTELEYSKRYSSEYYLYRVFEYDSEGNTGKVYIIKGKVNQSFNLFPTVFRASRR